MFQTLKIMAESSLPDDIVHHTAEEIVYSDAGQLPGVLYIVDSNTSLKALRKLTSLLPNHRK